MTSGPRWVVRGGLVAILLLGVGLRFYRLTEQSLWYDEGFSVYLARLPLGVMTQSTAQDVHPPLYYLLLHFWIRLVGDGPLMVRAFSGLGGVLSIPLAYKLSRRLWGRKAGLVAAFSMAISPLAVYYSQETRMYAWLTTLSLLSSYLALLISERFRVGRPPSWYWWVAYVLSILAGAYVHYFFLLLIVFQGLYMLVVWNETGRNRTMASATVLAYGAWALGYAPWAPVLLNRYLYDTGYLEGAMAPLESLRRIYMSFSVGPVLDGPAAWRISMAYASIILLAALPLPIARALGVRRGFRQPLRFLWMYLAIPLLIIVALYYQKARVSPHHSILVSPAFWALLAIGIASLWDIGEAMPRRPLRWLPRSLAMLAVLFIAATGIYANTQYYLAEQYHRPDFAGVCAFLRENVGPKDTVLLVSGHMFPIVDYYCPDLDHHPIPNDLVLRLDHQVGFEVSETLQEATEGKEAVWQVLWQDYFVDPHDVVGNLLASQSEPPIPVISFHKIRVRHFRLRPDAQFYWGNNIVLETGGEWEGSVRLESARLNKTTLVRGENLQLTLFWQTDRPIPASYHVFTHLIDEHGIVWSQHDSLPASGKRPTNGWRPGELVPDRHQIEIREAMPSGIYRIDIGLYRQDLPDMPRLSLVDASGHPVQDHLILGEIKVGP